MSLESPVPFLDLSYLRYIYPPGRMSQLGLSWLGPEVASPWQLLLLVGASWILARILTQIYAAYGSYRRLRGFPQPPKRNWLMGHVGMVSVASGWVQVSK